MLRVERSNPIHHCAMPRPETAPQPLSDRELAELQSLLDALPAPLDPLDVSALDGFLCGVLVQPEPVPRERWLAHAIDVEGRRLPTGYDAARLHALIGRRHAQLQRAIGRRTWFDPWVFDLDPLGVGAADDAEPDEADDEHGAAAAVEAVFPWVAGFAAALENFPALLRRAGPALNEPLALLYRHLDPDDIEDAADLLAEIDATEPPADLGEAVEQLVRATLLIADVAAALAPRR